jgi:hypothetical protein
MADTNIIRILLEAIDRNTGPVIQGATTNVAGLGKATKQTADEEKKLVGEFDNLMKRLDPATAAQARFTAGSAFLERGLKAQLISQQAAANGHRILQEELQASQRAAEGADLGFTRLNGTLAGTAIATALYAVGKAGLQAAEEAEQASARVDAVVRATGYAAGLTKAELDGLADSLAAATRFDDEELRNGIAVLLSFRNISEDSFARALTLSTDLAELMQTDFKSAVLQLGKALQEPETGITALTRAGVTFSDAQKEVIKQMIETGDRAGAMKLILDELEKQVGGTAERINSGLTRATFEASKAWGELMEALGKTAVVGGTARTSLNLISNELKEMKSITEDGDWLDRLLYAAKLNLGLIPALALPDLKPEVQKNSEVGMTQEERLAREGKLQQEINTLLETRTGIEKRLAAERDKVNQKNLTDQRDSLKTQIQGYRSLRTAMMSAFEDAGRAARQASKEAESFLDRAAAKRQSAKDRVLDRQIQQVANPDTTGLSEEDAAIVRARARDEADLKRSSAVSEALYQASVLRAKAVEELTKGNESGAQRLLDLSDQQIDRAGTYADQLEDESRARSAIEDVAEKSAQNDEKRAEIEQKRAAEETARREELGKAIAENDARLEAMDGELAGIEQRLKDLAEQKAIIAVEADQAAFDSVNAKIDELLRKKEALAKAVVVQPKAPAEAGTENLPGRSLGGPIFGIGPKGVDSVPILAAPGEHVWDDEEVDAVGGHDAMYRLRRLARLGLLGRFDIGGEVGASRSARSVINRIAIPSVVGGPGSAREGDTINLTLEGYGTYPLKANRATSSKLRTDIERAALMHGGLKQ